MAHNLLFFLNKHTLFLIILSAEGVSNTLEFELNIKTKVPQLIAEFNTVHKYLYLTEREFGLMSLQYRFNL